MKLLVNSGIKGCDRTKMNWRCVISEWKASPDSLSNGDEIMKRLVKAYMRNLYETR